MMEELIDNVYLQIDEDLLKYDLSSYQKRAERFAIFIGMDVHEFNRQNRTRAEKYLENLISSIKKGLSFPKSDIFPNLEEMSDYSFVRIFEENKEELFDSDYKQLLNQFYDDQLKDSISSKFSLKIRPAFKKVGVTPNEIADLFSLKRVSSDNKISNFVNIGVTNSGSWNIYADKQGIRKPKCIRYYCILRYGSDNKKLLLDLAYFDFRALLLNAGPFPDYSKYSVDECEELEFVKQFIQLSIFQTITTALDDYFTTLRLL